MLRLAVTATLFVANVLVAGLWWLAPGDAEALQPIAAAPSHAAHIHPVSRAADHALIGITIRPGDAGFDVVDVLDGSGAEAAGLFAGDRIRRVDGVDVRGWSLGTVRNRITGPHGTTVSLGVERDGAVRAVRVERSVVFEPPRTGVTNPRR